MTPDSSPEGAPGEARIEIFSRLWGVALVAHVVGNWGQPGLPSPIGWANLAVGLVGVLLVLRPDWTLLAAGSLLVLVSVILEIPFTGNHWLVAALVSAAILATIRRPTWFPPTARWILLVFYGFAAFAKLNTGFFDPSASCAVFYANQSLTSLRLPAIDSVSWLASAAIWATVIVELSIPFLLAFRRSRYVGVVVGSVFHAILSFDLGQHFYDFSAVLLPLFFLFVPDEGVARIESAWKVNLKGRSQIATVWMVVGATLVILAVLPPSTASTRLLSSIPFVLWIPATVVWMSLLLRARAAPQRLEFSTGFVGALLVGLTFVNGLTPYTEVKTAYSFNMYANLVTAQGASNHFVIRSTIPLRDGYLGPVRIVSSSDAGLEEYRHRGYEVAYPQLRVYLRTHPDTSLTYVRFGETLKVPRAGDDEEFGRPVPWWWSLLPLRAIDMNTPPRCQDVFLAAL